MQVVITWLEGRTCNLNQKMREKSSRIFFHRSGFEKTSWKIDKKLEGKNRSVKSASSWSSNLAVCARNREMPMGSIFMYPNEHAIRVFWSNFLGIRSCFFAFQREIVGTPVYGHLLDACRSSGCFMLAIMVTEYFWITASDELIVEDNCGILKYCWSIELEFDSWENWEKLGRMELLIFSSRRRDGHVSSR